MNKPLTIDTAQAKPASLAERILAGDLSECPDEPFSDEEWHREAQSVVDCEDDDGPLLWMIDVAREAMRERERQWQRETGRYSLNDYRDGVGRHPCSPVMMPGVSAHG